jgi:porin
VSPGRASGARRSPRRCRPPRPKPPAPALRDWFGSRPVWEWSRLTGDWGGARTALEDAGLTFNASLRLDWQSVWSGGVRERASTKTLWNINAALDLEKLVGLKGGTVYSSFQSINGRGQGDSGALQVPSSLEVADSRDQIDELWYQQWLFDDFLRIKVGKVDANLEFGFPRSAGTFSNAVLALSPTYLVMPTYPDPATSVNVFVYPTKKTYLGFGLYDGATADGFRTGTRGPATFFSDSKSDSWYMIGEGGINWDTLGGLKGGRLAGGVWHSTADFAQFDGGTSEGTTGGYIIAEQTVWTPSDLEAEGDTRGLTAFVRWAMADADVSVIEHNVTGGVALKGTFPGRRADEAGAMVSWARLTGDRGAGFGRNETAFEVYYKLQLTPAIALTPNIQYIAEPGGNKSLDDAVVGGLRLGVSF